MRALLSSVGLALTIVCSAICFAPAATSADRAVLAALQRAAAPVAGHTAVLRRVAADDELDVVLALANQQPFEAAPGAHPWWGTKSRLGLFLQSRRDSGRVYRLAVAAGPNDDCSIAIEQMTAHELVLSCTGEKWATYDNWKFVYDPHAKALVKQFTYAPFHCEGVLRGPRGPRFPMNDGRRSLLVGVGVDGAWQITAAPESAPPAQAAAFGPGGRFRLSKEKNQFGEEFPVIVEGSDGARRRYPLPQSGERAWREARPDDVASRAQLNPAEENEQIGPLQPEGDRLWFGKTFYNSEGSTGVGGFGYFDFAGRKYRLYSPPEIWRWSVSAILVEPGAVWLGLFRRGEYGDIAGGLLRWDRATEQARLFQAASIVTSIGRGGEALYMGARDGLLVLRDERIVSYFVDRTTTGRYRVVPRR
jgi:hypothetical protein